MEAYKVEIEENGCKHCTAGRQWIVVDPDGIGGGESFGDEEAAQDIADVMNMAYAAGMERAAKIVDESASTDKATDWCFKKIAQAIRFVMAGGTGGEISERQMCERERTVREAIISLGKMGMTIESLAVHPQTLHEMVAEWPMQAVRVTAGALPEHTYCGVIVHQVVR